MKVGILTGREKAFPDAFIDRVNRKYAEGITAEMVMLGGTRLGEEIPYRVIVDRISHEIPYYRSYLKKAVADGVTVINNPFWWSADDKFFECILASNLGVAVPRTVVLPNRDYEADIIEESLRNLVPEIPWDRHLDYVGLPAVLKPAIGGGNKNISIVHSREELLRAYEESGPLLMILQELIDYESYLRCFCLGRNDVLVSNYLHNNPRVERYIEGFEGISPLLIEQARDICLTLNRALGYDMNTVELAIRDGIPYAIDFLNPAPDFDIESIRPERFEWVVETMANMVIEYALGEISPAADLRWQAMMAAPWKAPAAL